MYLNPPLYWIEALFKAKNPIIDLGEHYIKQSFRNRYHIAGANGIERLVVPLEKGKNQKTPMHQVRISYAENWVHQHKKALQTAYSKTPFYAYYGPEIEDIYAQNFPYLTQLNRALLEWILKELGLTIDSDCVSLSYIENCATDLRKPVQEYKSVSYRHLYKDRYNVESDISILDALFQEGRAARLLFL